MANNKVIQQILTINSKKNIKVQALLNLTYRQQ